MLPQPKPQNHHSNIIQSSTIPNVSFNVDSDDSIAFSNLIASRQKENSEEVKKGKYNISSDECMLLSFWEHFLLTYLCCCVCGRTKKVNDYYKSISNDVDQYTDMLNITNNMMELDKIKYLLMDKDQTAYFNTRSKIQLDPAKVATSEYSKYYYFTKQLNEDVKLDEIDRSLGCRYEDKVFNRKIRDLTD